MPRKPKLPIYNRLRVLRAEMELSRAELAERVGVNPQTVGAIERGDHYPTLDLALNISDVFGVSVEAVFSREPFTYTPSSYSSSAEATPAVEPDRDPASSHRQDAGPRDTHRKSPS